MRETHSDTGRTNAGQGTSRPATGLDTGRTGTGAAEHRIPDPDYGIDPKVASPMYGGAGRGSDDTVAQASMSHATVEGDNLSGMTDDATTGGTARAGDMTSTADTFDNTEHSLGESGVRGTMATGVNRPPASSAATGRRGNQDQMVDPNDTGTFEEGMQHAEGRRA